MREYFLYRKLLNTPIKHLSIKHIILDLLLLFLDWGFKKKLLLLSGSIAFFPLYILGVIYLNINIPSGSIENSFSSSLPILLDHGLINSLFSWQFITVFILIIMGLVYFIKKIGWTFVQLHRQRIIK